MKNAKKMSYLVEEITKYTQKRRGGSSQKRVMLKLIQEDPAMGPWASDKPTYDEKVKTFFMHLSLKKFNKCPQEKNSEILLGKFETYTKEFKPRKDGKRERDENGKKITITLTYIKNIE